jgi:hypothetical protein
VTLLSLQAKLTKEKELEEKRVTANTTRQEKAQARYDRYREVLTAQQAILQKRLDSFEEIYTQSVNVWDKREQEMIKAHTARVAAWNTRISTVDAASGGHLANMNVQIEVPPLNVPPAQPIQQIPADCQIAVKWNASQLPVISRDLSDQEEQVLSVVMQNVRAWQCNGTIPATYEMLATGLTSEKRNIVDAFSQIVGQDIWTAFYGERKITHLNYVPAQLGTVIREALDRVREVLDKSKHAKVSSEAAGKVFAKHLSDDTKRRKLPASAKASTDDTEQL